MALTQEQVYNLGIGDEIIVHGKCEDVYGDGDIRVNTYWTVAGEKREQSFLVHSSYVSLPPEKTKYDPCRLFKKGDIVRLKKWNGRCPAIPEDWKFDTGLFVVYAAEKFNSSVEIARENSGVVYVVPVCFLELVTPVEELEPYSIEEVDVDSLIYNPKLDPDRDSESAFHVRYMDKRSGEITIIKTYYESYIYSYDCAKADAEAERDRLNAEYKKENMPI